MAAADASAARTFQDLARIRTVVVHLTAFAPGCADRTAGDRRRNRTFWDRPPVRVVASVLRKLGRAAAEVAIFEHPSGDVDLLTRVEPFGEVPVASFWDGLTAAEARAALDALSAIERRKEAA